MNRPDAWVAEESVPTPKEMAIIKNFADADYDIARLRESAVKAGAAPSEISTVTGRALKKIANNPRFQKALKKQGVTYDRLAEKVSQLLDAKHPQYPDQNDNIAQGKALEFAAKALDAMPAQKLELDKTERHVIMFAPETIRAIEKAKGVKVIDIEPESVKGYFE